MFCAPWNLRARISGFGHPRGDGIGRGTHDDLDAGLAHGVDHAVHPRVLEAAILRLPQAPGRLAQANHVETGGLHHLHVLFQTLVRHVFMVIGRAVQDGRLRRYVGCRRAERAGQRGGQQGSFDHAHIPRCCFCSGSIVPISRLRRQRPMRNLRNFVFRVGGFCNCGARLLLPQCSCKRALLWKVER